MADMGRLEVLGTPFPMGQRQQAERESGRRSRRALRQGDHGQDRPADGEVLGGYGRHCEEAIGPTRQSRNLIWVTVPSPYPSPQGEGIFIFSSPSREREKSASALEGEGEKGQ